MYSFCLRGRAPSLRIRLPVMAISASTMSGRAVCSTKKLGRNPNCSRMAANAGKSFSSYGWFCKLLISPSPKQCAQVYTRTLFAVPRVRRERENLAIYWQPRLSMSQPATISNESSRSYPQLIGAYGFVPNLFLAQSAIPQAIEAEQKLINTVVFRQGRLSRDHKD